MLQYVFYFLLFLIIVVLLAYSFFCVWNYQVLVVLSTRVLNYGLLAWCTWCIILFSIIFLNLNINPNKLLLLISNKLLAFMIYFSLFLHIVFFYVFLLVFFCTIFFES